MCSIQCIHSSMCAQFNVYRATCVLNSMYIQQHVCSIQCIQSNMCAVSGSELFAIGKSSSAPLSLHSVSSLTLRTLYFLIISDWLVMFFSLDLLSIWCGKMDTIWLLGTVKDKEREATIRKHSCAAEERPAADMLGSRPEVPGPREGGKLLPEDVLPRCTVSKLTSEFTPRTSLRMSWKFSASVQSPTTKSPTTGTSTWQCSQSRTSSPSLVNPALLTSTWASRSWRSWTRGSSQICCWTGPDRESDITMLDWSLWWLAWTMKASRCQCWLQRSCWPRPGIWRTKQSCWRFRLVDTILFSLESSIKPIHSLFRHVFRSIFLDVYLHT